MITSIKGNSEEYGGLFQKATNDLKKQDGLQSIQVTDLEGYFANIERLKAIDIKYIILPLDEPHFFIDANSRKINVPEEFRKNGIAVKGDQTAEVIYFKIDRYFDFTDFDTCDIFIQWETSNGDKGVSIPLVKDVTSQPDYLIFGWPIDNRITNEAGTVKFSVRFVQYGEATQDGSPAPVVYSFSTLDTIATVNPALDLEDYELVEDDTINDMILNRIKNSNYSGGGTAAPAVFLLQPIEALGDDDGIVDLNEDGTLKLTAQAYSTDAGTVNYVFKKLYKGNTTTVPTDMDYVELPENSLAEEYKVYYVEDAAPGSYVALANVSAGDNLTDKANGAKVYDRFGTTTVDSVGEYTCVAENVKGQNTNTSAISTPVIVPGPGATAISFPADQKVIADPTVELKPSIVNDNATSFTYSWYKDNTLIPNANLATYEVIGTSDFTADIQGEYKVKAVATRNKEEVSSVDEPSVLVTYPADTFAVSTSATGKILTATVEFDHDYQLEGINNLEYNWYIRKQEEKPADYINPETGLLNDTVLGTTNTNTFDATNTGEGYYYCKVVNTYNGSTTTAQNRSQTNGDKYPPTFIS